MDRSTRINWHNVGGHRVYYTDRCRFVLVYEYQCLAVYDCHTTQCHYFRLRPNHGFDTYPGQPPEAMTLRHLLVQGPPPAVPEYTPAPEPYGPVAVYEPRRVDAAPRYSSGAHPNMLALAVAGFAVVIGLLLYAHNEQMKALMQANANTGQRVQAVEQTSAETSRQLQSLTQATAEALAAQEKKREDLDRGVQLQLEAMRTLVSTELQTVRGDLTTAIAALAGGSNRIAASEAAGNNQLTLPAKQTADAAPKVDAAPGGFWGFLCSLVWHAVIMVAVVFALWVAVLLFQGFFLTFWRA